MHNANTIRVRRNGVNAVATTTRGCEQRFVCLLRFEFRIASRVMKPRILVIDDESAIRDSLRMILEYENYEFSGAASGPDGLAQIKRDPPDMVVLDIKMPGTNGLETLAEIRRSTNRFLSR
jgi:PleD family two-component response regulator